LPILKVFHEGLRDHGWIEGKNLIIDTLRFGSDLLTRSI